MRLGCNTRGIFSTKPPPVITCHSCFFVFANLEYALILEDDANLVESLDYLYDCLKHLPTEFDMCHIAMVDCYPFIKTNKVNEYWYSVVKQYFNRATAYIISKKGAQKIIDYTNNYINVPADDLLSNMHLQNKLQVIVPETYAFMEKNNVSIIEKISS